MDFLLRLKHWQIFLLLIGLPIIIRIPLMIKKITSEDSFSGFDNINFLSLLPMIISMTVSLGWFYVIGKSLHKKLPNSVKMNLARFKIFLFILVVYALLICIFTLFRITYTFANEEIPALGLYGLFVPLQLFSMFCIFYCMYFNAKALKAIEMQRPVTFEDFAGDFFSFLFYPIGVWFIQPRINKLFDNKNELPA